MHLSTRKDLVARFRRAGNRPTIRRMLETRPANVAAPVAPAAVEEPLPDEELGWEPLALPRAVRSRRTYRIPVILIALTAATGVYLGAQFLLRLPQAQADDQRAASAQILNTALDAMPDLEAAAATIASDGPSGELAAPLATLVRLEGIAAEVKRTAEPPVVLLIPGLPTDDFEMLEPVRDRMDGVAERITAVGGVLTDVVTYRKALDQMFLLPDLPGPTEGPSVEVFSERLSIMTAATVQAAALLPDGDLFSGHRSQVEALLAWLPEWQASYVEALRDDDLGAADRLRSAATVRIDQLRKDLSAPLDTAHTWAIDSIRQLTLDIQAALVLAA